MNWFLFWLFLHILTAVIAFGPIFTFPIIGIQAQRNPQHVHFAAVLSEKIERGLVVPLALTMLVSGTGLLVTARINLLRTTYLWVAIVLYLAAVTIALTILIPTTAKQVEMTAQMPAPAPGTPGAGPPPALLALVRRSQIFGTLTQVLFLIIIFLMIVQAGRDRFGPLFG